MPLMISSSYDPILKGTVCCDTTLFRYDPAPNNCVPLDLCSAETNDCDVNADCANILPSGRTCTCKKGYVGDGLSTGTGCTDEDNCINTSIMPSTGPTWSNCGPYANCVDKLGTVRNV